ncbi:MAG TPA: 1-acyl-sn-glycerol-3-phosphate acyltransferase [Myxococcota bacterium]|nr:1-acyl-sn-glycerol-3-phosphate acyltransferase [Myxococcota bacterium]
MLPLDENARRRLATQRVVGHLLAPLWIFGAALVLRYVCGYRIVGRAEARARYRALRAGGRSPLLLCANHLTLVDSVLIAWALGSPAWYLWHFSGLAWNVPERRNFASSWWSRALVYVLKCLPITRGGDRREISSVLSRVSYLLESGEAVLIFPEAGRSRSGRIDVEAAAWGVGRIVGSVPACRVLCIYLRGERQSQFSDLPARGQRFRVELALLEPKSDLKGLRRSMDLSRQIVTKLAEMEQRWLDGQG